MAKSKPVKPKWTTPVWLCPYVPSIVNTGGNDIEDLMNDHTANVQTNAPRAMICACVQSQVALLEKLREKGLIK